MTLTLSDIPTELNAALQRRAAEEHRSVDQVALDAIRVGLGLAGHKLNSGENSSLAASIRARFAPMGGVELAQPHREPIPPPLDFSE